MCGGDEFIAAVDILYPNGESAQNQESVNICKHHIENMQPDRITLDSLPSNIFHLGGVNFVTISSHCGETYVGIQKYEADDFGFWYPTKDCVSLTPTIWYTFCLQSFVGNESAFLVGKDLIISKHIMNGEEIVSLQLVCQADDFSLQLYPEYVVLNAKQIHELELKTDVIHSTLKKNLLSYSMRYYVYQYMQNRRDAKLQYIGNLSNEEGLPELVDSLCKCIKKVFSVKIAELLKCFGCLEGNEYHYGHDCIKLSPHEKFKYYFNIVYYGIEWNELAKLFVDENATNNNFERLIFANDFFQVIDVDNVFQKIENLYVNDEIILYESILSMFGE